MDPKSGNRFSDKIMLKTKNLAHADINQAWRTARRPPTSGRAGAGARPRLGQAGDGGISFAAPPSRCLAKRYWRDPRSRSERMTPRNLILEFSKVGHLPF